MTWKQTTHEFTPFWMEAAVRGYSGLAVMRALVAIIPGTQWCAVLQGFLQQGIVPQCPDLCDGSHDIFVRVILVGIHPHPLQALESFNDEWGVRP